MIIHHESVIDKESFDLIKLGAKHFKFYLNDEKRQGLKIGDFIKYINKSTSETLLVLVSQIIKAKNSAELANTLNLDATEMAYINNWFSIQAQNKYGLLAVKIKREK
jgi:ASC-1-like (ASCH) protein